MVPFAADRLPAGLHGAGIGQVIPRAARAQPARLHGARAAEVVVRAVDDGPAGSHGPRAVEVILRSAETQPSSRHSAGAGEVIPRAARAQPAGLHNARTVEVVVRSINHAPARGHRARIVEPIPGAANLLPAGLHNARAGKVVPRAAQIQPARLHIARSIEVVVRAVDDAPFVRGIAAVVVGVPPTARSSCPVARKRDVIASTTYNVKACIHARTRISSQAMGNSKASTWRNVIRIRKVVVAPLNKRFSHIGNQGLRRNLIPRILIRVTRKGNRRTCQISLLIANSNAQKTREIVMTINAPDFYHVSSWIKSKSFSAYFRPLGGRAPLLNSIPIIPFHAFQRNDVKPVIAYGTTRSPPANIHQVALGDIKIVGVHTIVAFVIVSSTPPHLQFLAWIQ